MCIKIPTSPSAHTELIEEVANWSNKKGLMAGITVKRKIYRGWSGTVQLRAWYFRRVVLTQAQPTMPCMRTRRTHRSSWFIPWRFRPTPWLVPVFIAFTQLRSMNVRRTKVYDPWLRGDEKGSKMSKSLGNIITPQDIIKDMGADGLRFWIARLITVMKWPQVKKSLAVHQMATAVFVILLRFLLAT